MTTLDELDPEQRDKLLGDIFCVRCQKAFRAGDDANVREFRGNQMIEAKCPTCGETAVKPVKSQ